MNRLKDIWKKYKRERKEDRLETITGYLDFGYESARTIWEICMTQLLLFGILALYFIERNELSEMQKVFGNTQGEGEQMMWLLASLIWCMVAGTLVYHGIPVFTLSKMFGMGFGAWIIKYILIFIMEFAGLPSRNVVRCITRTFTDGKPDTGGIRLEE